MPGCSLLTRYSGVPRYGTVSGCADRQRVIDVPRCSCLPGCSCLPRCIGVPRYSLMDNAVGAWM